MLAQFTSGVGQSLLGPRKSRCKWSWRWSSWLGCPKLHGL